MPRTELCFGAPTTPNVNTLIGCRKSDDPPVLQLASQWMHTCKQTHILCNDRRPFDRYTQQQSSYVPSRLVHITNQGDRIQAVRLVTSSEIGATTSYLTLSHCWGGAPILKLTRASLSSFKVDIPISSLPRTFTDAFLVTLKLGYNHIWIDSLCIIQDCDDDWKVESNQMGDVYRHSQCTIAAVKARNSHGGLFSERLNLQFNVPCELIKKDVHNRGVYVAQKGRSVNRPLYDRAWVMQEQCLSNRLLEFGADQLSWACIEARASEEKPGFGKQLLALNQQAYNIFNGTSEFIGMEIMVHPTPHWIRTWWNIVLEYSFRQLTYIFDRFPAIAGLSHLIEQAKSIRMVQGLWKQYMPFELLWCIWEPDSFERLNAGFPSWSWLSTIGMVSHEYYTRMRSPTHLANVVLNANGPVADLEPAHSLTINARLLRVTCAYSIHEESPNGGETYYTYPFRFCDSRSFRIEDDMWDGNWLPDTLPERSEGFRELEVWSLQILQDEACYHPGYTASFGLMVTPVNQEGTIFRRVGYYDIKWKEDMDDSVEDDTATATQYDSDDGYEVAQTWEVRDGERWFGEMRTIQLI